MIFHEEAVTAPVFRPPARAGHSGHAGMFPAVPQGAARLRLCVTAAHTRQDLEFALDAFKGMKERARGDQGAGRRIAAPLPHVRGENLRTAGAPCTTGMLSTT